MSAIATVAQQIVDQMTTPEMGADPTPAPTPGPFLQLIEQIIQMLLPMLAACIPAVATQTAVINRPRLLHREQLAATINAHTASTAPRVAILHAMLSVGTKLKQTDVSAMHAEAASPPKE